MTDKKKDQDETKSKNAELTPNKEDEELSALLDSRYRLINVSSSLGLFSHMHEMVP